MNSVMLYQLTINVKKLNSINICPLSCIKRRHDNLNLIMSCKKVPNTSDK